jgi:hypothetical protein
MTLLPLIRNPTVIEIRARRIWAIIEETHMTFIKPTIGRKVWYHAPDEAIHSDDSLPLDATICYVHNDGLVNLRVTDQVGNSHPRPSIPLIQEGDATPNGSYCYWMDYQISQAAKHSAEVAPQMETQDVS